jgi:hypothetical protein
MCALILSTNSVWNIFHGKKNVMWYAVRLRTLKYVRLKDIMLTPTRFATLKIYRVKSKYLAIWQHMYSARLQLL